MHSFYNNIFYNNTLHHSAQRFFRLWRHFFLVSLLVVLIANIARADTSNGFSDDLDSADDYEVPISLSTLWHTHTIKSDTPLPTVISFEDIKRPYPSEDDVINDGIMFRFKVDIDPVQSKRQEIMRFSNFLTLWDTLRLVYKDGSLVAERGDGDGNYLNYALQDELFLFLPQPHDRAFELRVYVAEYFLWFEVTPLKVNGERNPSERRLAPVFFGLGETIANYRNRIGTVTFGGDEGNDITLQAGSIQVYSFNYSKVRDNINYYYAKGRDLAVIDEPGPDSPDPDVDKPNPDPGNLNPGYSKIAGYALTTRTKNCPKHSYSCSEELGITIFWRKRSDMAKHQAAVRARHLECEYKHWWSACKHIPKWGKWYVYDAEENNAIPETNTASVTVWLRGDYEVGWSKSGAPPEFKNIDRVEILLRTQTKTGEPLGSDSAGLDGNDIINGLTYTTAAALLSVGDEHLDVPGDYSTIQSAINAAMDGDTIVVAPGIYTEQINFNGKAINIRSTNPLDPAVVAATIIDGGGIDGEGSGPVVTFASGEDRESVLTGFTITGGDSSTGGGIFINNSSPTLSDNIIEGNSGSGLYAVDSNALVQRCLFRNNIAPVGPAIYSGGQFGSLMVTSSRFENNAGESSGAISDLSFAGGHYSNNTFIDNTTASSSGTSATMFVYSHNTVLENNYFENNHSPNGDIHILANASPVMQGNSVCGSAQAITGGDGDYGDTVISLSCGVTPPYTTGFELFAPEELQPWYFHSDHGDGLVTLTGEYFSHSGETQLVLAKTRTGDHAYVTNAATLSLDLSGGGDALLSFWWKELGNGDETHAEDGVFLSDDGGQTWSPRVYALTEGDTGSYTYAELDLAGLAMSYGLDLNSPRFMVKFQQYDDAEALYDGIAIDDVAVTAGRGPVLHYDFSTGTETTLYDNSGYGYEGFLNGTVEPVAVDVGNGMALRFHGGLDLLRSGNLTSIDIPVEVFSEQLNSDRISVAVLEKSLPDNDAALFDASGAMRGVLPADDGRLYWQTAYGASYDTIGYTPTPAQITGWNHWVMTKNVATGVMNIYRNGRLLHTESGKTLPIGTAVNAFTLGLDDVFMLGLGFIPNHYRGEMADFQVFDRELSATEVSELYHQTAQPLINVAAGTAVTASSSGFGTTPEDAVDGDTDGNHFHGSVFHSALETQPWWQTDLGAEFNISHINIYNRTDCCAERLDNFTVFVSYEPFTGTTIAELEAEASLVYQHDGVVGSANPIVLPMNTPGRYVRVQLPGDQYLQLAEVEVMVESPLLSTFTGGDTGEGLDLDGDFVYAVNVNGPGSLPVRDANFSNEAAVASAVTIGAGENHLYWNTPQYGFSQNDDNLEMVMESIRWSRYPAPLTADLAVTPGATYKLQLLFMEKCCDRAFDINIEGSRVIPSLNVGKTQGGITNDNPGVNNNTGVVATYQFTAADDTLNIILGGTDTLAPDDNPILSALTLELLQETSNAAPTIAITDPQLPVGFANEAYGPVTFASVSDAEDDPASLIVSATGLPSWMSVSLNSSGDVVLSGTVPWNPDNQYSFTVTVQDSGGLSTTSSSVDLFIFNPYITP